MSAPWSTESGPHPAAVDDTAGLRTTLRAVRTTLAAVLGLGAVLGLAASLVLVIGAQAVIRPDQPGRALSLWFSIPQARAEAAREMVRDLEAEQRATLSSGQRAELTAALDEVMASAALHDLLMTTTAVDGRVDWTPVLEVIASELRAQADDRPAEAGRALTRAADEILRMEDTSMATGDGLESWHQLRRWVTIAGLVLAVPAIVLAVLAVAVARRRSLTVVAVSSGSLLVSVLVLAPGRWVLDHLGGWLEAPAAAIAAIGTMSGPGLVWSLLAASLVPAATWWAVRSWRASHAEWPVMP